jgi:hypothetical protein
VAHPQLRRICIVEAPSGSPPASWPGDAELPLRRCKAGRANRDVHRQRRRKRRFGPRQPASKHVVLKKLQHMAQDGHADLPQVTIGFISGASIALRSGARLPLDFRLEAQTLMPSSF